MPPRNPQWQFDDLKNLVTRLKQLGLTLTLTPTLLADARIKGHARLTVTAMTNDRPTTVSTLLYLKPNANPIAAADGERVPHHMDTERWRDDRDSVDMIRKIEWYQRTKADTDFPHTSTFIQRYDWETFEAYRLLGFQMAKTYLPYNDLAECKFRAAE
jgi:hypothetical protein